MKKSRSMCQVSVHLAPLYLRVDHGDHAAVDGLALLGYARPVGSGKKPAVVVPVEELSPLKER